MDWVKETKANVEILLDLEIGEVSIVLCVPNTWNQIKTLDDIFQKFYNDDRILRVSTEYLTLSVNYLKDNKTYKKLFGDKTPLVITPWKIWGENEKVKIFLSFGATEAKPPEEVDIIIPFIHNIEVRHKGRRIISSIYRFIINISFGTNLNYTNGTVFYRRCILDDLCLNSFGFFYQTELLVKLIRKGYLFSEVPNLLSSRIGGQSKATTLSSLIRLTGNYLKLFYEIHIKRIESAKDYRKLNSHSVSYKIRKKYVF